MQGLVEALGTPATGVKSSMHTPNEQSWGWQKLRNAEEAPAITLYKPRDAKLSLAMRKLE